MRAGSTVAGLLESGQAAALAADPAGLVRDAIEEGLRWVSPIGTQTRRALAETELGGVAVPAGANLGVLVSSANRDEDGLGRRRPTPSISSGRAATTRRSASGPHFCSGHHFSRVQMRIAIQRLFERLPGPPPRSRAATGVQRLGVSRTAAPARPVGRVTAGRPRPGRSRGRRPARDVGAASLHSVVARVGDRWFAFETWCTHAECPLTDGWLEGEAVRCACHGSLFALADGCAARGAGDRADPDLSGRPPRRARAGRDRPGARDPDPARREPFAWTSRVSGARARGRDRGEAWRSFDHARAHEPPIDERHPDAPARALPESPSPVLEVLEDARLALDETIAQVRPRFFAFVASSGLEIGVLGDLLASCFDANLAVWAAAATEVEDQAVRWVAEFVGFPAAAGAFTSGGTISNMTALAAARERAMPGSRRDRLRRRRGDALLLRARRTTRSSARPSCSASARRTSARCPIDGERRLVPEAVAEAIAADRAAGRIAGRRRRDGGHDADRRRRSDRRAGRRVRRARTCGSTSTARTVFRPRRPRRPAGCFAGLDRADSVTLDAHKWLYLPKACGVLLVRRRDGSRRSVRPRGGVHPARALRATWSTSRSSTHGRSGR